MSVINRGPEKYEAAEEMVPLYNLTHQITAEQIFFAVVALVLLILAFFFVRLVKGVLETLSRVNSTADLVNNTIEEIRPAVEGVTELEKTLKAVLDDTSGQVKQLQSDASRLMEVLGETALAYKRLEETLEERIKNEVPPILVETKDLVTGAKEITEDIQEKIKATDNLFEAVNEAGQTVKMATGIVRGGITGLAVQLASMAVGARTSLEYISQNISNKKEKNSKGGD